MEFFKACEKPTGRQEKEKKSERNRKHKMADLSYKICKNYIIGKSSIYTN